MKVISQPDNVTRRTSLANDKSGVAMDRVLTKKRLPLGKLTTIAAFFAAAALIGWYLFDQTGGRSLVIENSRVVISPVTEGLFEDFIPIRSRVTPRSTVFLDIIDGGQVEQRLIDDGAMVKAGDLIVVLNNTSLQLEVARNEALVAEQLNN
ncbi:MAG: biotin/lipoyl-binding protein, partial [Gammaproteobacteria bacterium]|nr:biotin/lipoyl-binding protein [Gammaproteobacteria bacterium]